MCSKTNSLNCILQQYHQTFDDSKVRKLLEELEQMMSERALFFHNNNLNLDEDSKLFEDIGDYWCELDDLGYGSNAHDEILDKLRNNVTGLETCGCCEKIGIIKPKILSSILSDKVYLVNLCENCISKKNWTMKYKEEVEHDTKIPLELPEQEKQLMIQYQEKMKS